MCESFVHECLKSSLAFRKPAMAVVSRCPARTEGLQVGLDIGHATVQASALGAAPRTSVKYDYVVQAALYE